MLKILRAMLVPCLAGLIPTAAQAQILPPSSHEVVDVYEDAAQRLFVLRYLLVKPAAPLRQSNAVMLFAGGNGVLGIQHDGTITTLSGNFLVRSRQLFAQAGLPTAVVDAPARYRTNGTGLDGNERSSAQYAQDISRAIADLRSRTGASRIWLVGTSTGTLSAASVAARLPKQPILRPVPAKANLSRPDGIVLTSAQTVIVPGQCGVTVFQNNQAFKLSSVNVPGYVVAHIKDACPCHPAKEAPHVVKDLTKAPHKASKLWSGEISTGDVCQAFAHHGFNGIEQAVVSDIVNWMRTH